MLLSALAQHENARVSFVPPDASLKVSPRLVQNAIKIIFSFCFCCASLVGYDLVDWTYNIKVLTVVDT